MSLLLVHVMILYRQVTVESNRIHLEKYQPYDIKFAKEHLCADMLKLSHLNPHSYNDLSNTMLRIHYTCTFLNKWQSITGFTADYVIDHSFLPTTWTHMHSRTQAELCLKKLQPGDNLINQLSVISTLNHWCLLQIAFLSSSLGLKRKEGFVLLHRVFFSSFSFFPTPVLPSPARSAIIVRGISASRLWYRRLQCFVC